MKVCFAVHGILTGQTDASWPDAFDAYTFAKVVKKEYRAGPFPIWNVFVKNPRLARALYNEACLFNPQPVTPTELYFVAHSNGCDIALKAIKLLAQNGYRVAGAIFIGAVLRPDLHESGVAGLLESGALGKAVALASGRDKALAIQLKWPYSDLGRTGWVLEGVPVREAVIGSGSAITRRFDAWGHGDYFTGANRLTTFDLICKEFGLPH